MDPDGGPAPRLKGFQPLLTFVPERLPAVGGVFEPGGLSNRGQTSVTGWAVLEGTGCCTGQQPREAGVLHLWLAVTFFAQHGGCHTPGNQHEGDVDLTRVTQGKADWAWGGKMVLTKAESEVYGESEGGVNVVGCCGGGVGVNQSLSISRRLKSLRSTQ